MDKIEKWTKLKRLIQMEKKIGQIWRLFLQMGMKKIKIQISLVVPKNNPENLYNPYESH